MYSEAFCRMYNLLGWNTFPEAFAPQLLAWLARRGAKVRRSVDLACGTGVLCEALAAAGIEAMGVDLSEGMIAVARERNPAIRYEVGDMTAWRGSGFDLVTCTGDALNHILSPGDVSRVFENTFASLNPGGHFVFDLLGAGEVPSEEPFELDFSERVRAVFSVRREGEAVTLTTRVYEDGAFLLEENIRERLYDPQDVLALLRAAGFRALRCGHSLLEDTSPAPAWFIAARRPG